MATLISHWEMACHPLKGTAWPPPRLASSCQGSPPPQPGLPLCLQSTPAHPCKPLGVTPHHTTDPPCSLVCFPPPLTPPPFRALRAQPGIGGSQEGAGARVALSCDLSLMPTNPPIARLHSTSSLFIIFPPGLSQRRTDTHIKGGRLQKPHPWPDGSGVSAAGCNAGAQAAQA